MKPLISYLAIMQQTERNPKGLEILPDGLYMDRLASHYFMATAFKEYKRVYTGHCYCTGCGYILPTFALRTLSRTGRFEDTQC